jgi:acyl-CoA thioester hydrolase
MFISDTQIRVRYAETDQMGVVYYGNYAQYFEVARAESIRQLGYTYKDMEDSGIIMPVVEMHVKFIRPARYDELLSIRSIVKELPSGHRIDFHQEVYNEKKKLLTTGHVALFFIQADTRQKVSMPIQLHDKLAPYFAPGNPALP